MGGPIIRPSQVPSADEKDGLAAASPAISASNPVVTSQDPRLVSAEEHDLFRNSLIDRLCSGLVSGGGLTVTGAHTTLKVGAGVGYITDHSLAGYKRVTWVETDDLVAVVDGTNYVSIDGTGGVIISQLRPSMSSRIYLGHIYAAGGMTMILEEFSVPEWTGHYQGRVNEWVAQAMGTLVHTGSKVVEQPGPNFLEITVTQGEFYSRLGKYTPSETSVFGKMFLTADYGWYGDDSGPNRINVTHWNNTANGVATALVAMTTGYWKKDMILQTPNGHVYYIYSQAEYATEDAALAAPAPAIPDAITEDIIRLAEIISQEGDTSISSRIRDIRPMLSRLFGYGADPVPIILDHGSLLGLGDDDHSQYLTEGRADLLYPVINHDHDGGGGAQIDHVDLANVGDNTHDEIDTHIEDTSIHFVDPTPAHELAFDHDLLHSNADDPSSGEKAALAGTKGTPSDTNRYVTHLEISHPQNIRVCFSGNADFATIKAAMDSIADASATKPYMVHVDPGVYVESPFTMKPYVSIMGGGGFYSTIIQTNDNDNHFITGAANSEIFNVAIDGPTGVGRAAIYYTATGFGPMKMIDSTIRKGYYGIWCYHASTRVRFHFIHSGNWYAASTIHKFFYATGYGNITVMDSALMSGPANSITTGSEVDGVNAEITLDNVAFRGPTTHIKCTDGLIRCKSVSFAEGVNAIVAAGSGVIDVIGGAIEPEVTNHIIINDNTAKVIFDGKADKNKIDNAVGGDLIASINDDTPGEEGVVVFGELWLGTQSASIPIRSSTLDTFSTGWVLGGNVTQTAGAGNEKKVDVALGAGYVNTGSTVKRVEWDAVSALTITDNTTGWVVVDQDGVVAYVTAEPSYVSYILLAVVGADATKLVGLADHRIPVAQLTPHIAEYLEGVIGPVCSTGCTVSANAADLKLNVEAGEFFESLRPSSISGGTAISFFKHYKNGSGGWVVTAPTDTCDIVNYDDGSGTLAAIPSGKYTKDNLFVVKTPVGEQYHYVYGQELFDTPTSAEVGNNPNPPANLLRYGMRLAGLVLQQGQTDFTSIVDARPFLGQSASGSTASGAHGDLTGLSNDDHTQYFNQTRGDGRYALTGAGVTNGDAHDHAGGDGSQIDHTTLSNKGTNDHAAIDSHLGAAAPHTGHAATTHTHAASDVTGTAVVTNDVRLSNARVPTSHGNDKHSSTFLVAADAVAPNAAITGATKTKITYDAKGLVTAGADATPADVGAEPANANIQTHVGVVAGNPHGTSYTNVGAEPAGAVSSHAGVTTSVHGFDSAGKASPQTHGNAAHTSTFITQANAVVPNTAITPGTNTKVTYDAKGLVTGGAAATPADIGAAEASHSHAPGDVTGTAVITNDARLSDARTPTTHAHTRTKTISWVIQNPATGGIPGPRIPVTGTITRIDSYVTAATSATFNVEKRGTIGSAGTNALASDQVATTTGASATSFASATLTAANWLWLDISGVSGVPGTLCVTITFTESE